MALRVDIWSDIACPWCYIGKRRFEAALRDFAHADEVEVVWRSFELDPTAPAIRDDGKTYAERLASKYRRSVAEAEGMIGNVVQQAATEGIEMRFDRARSGNTFDGHRLVHLAARHGLQGAMKERLLRAYFTEGQAMGDREALVALAVEVGLDGDEVRAALATDAHAAEVRADERLARELGISGVPFFVLDGKFGISGAQPAAALARALTEAYGQREVATPEGAACAALGCD
jgi:predicted DsbA family dithiol-disulfide isomerase